MPTKSSSFWLRAAAPAVAIMLMFGFSGKRRHSEEALLSDWSDPPPWPVFIGINALAGALRSMADALTPPPIRMLDYSTAYQTSMLAQICQSTQIPDFLATGPKTLSDLAAYLKTTDESRVERLMYAMAADGITQLDPALKKGEKPRFVNTALSATLRRDHPNSVAGMVGHMVQDGYESYGKLMGLFGEDAVDNVWEQVYPDYRGGNGIWRLFADQPEREEQFTRAMRSLEALGGKAMASDAPFEKFSRTIDVGGNLGHFLHKIMTANPNMKGVLFDRKEVIDHAEDYWYGEEGEFHDGTEQRFETMVGDFFNASSLPSAQDGDVYLLRYILHDWGHDDCLKILKNLKQTLQGKKATLMIGECAIPDRDTVGVPAIMSKIDMHMMSVFGEAKERTPQEWKELLEEAGFEFVALYPTRSAIHFVEAVPKD